MDLQPSFARTNPVAPPRVDAKAVARARQHRFRRLRKTVVAASVSTFVALWLLIYVQLASGHDPALATNTAPIATTVGATTGADPVPTPVPGAATATTATGSGNSSSSTTDPGAGTSSPTPMTTRAS
jgi:hypothetical protein